MISMHKYYYYFREYLQTLLKRKKRENVQKFASDLYKII